MVTYPNFLIKQTNMRKLGLFFSALLLCIITAAGQNRTLSGKVVDENGLPIAGASVQIKGSTKGVTADAAGNFKISVNEGAVIVVTAINFNANEVAVGDQTSLSVRLTRSEAKLDEVVVTALGIRRNKSSLPYATQQVTGDDITRTRTNNFVENLSGKVSGLQITSSNTMGGSSNVILRGMKSLTQSNQALFVVDGVPVDNSNLSRGNYDMGNVVSDLNPEDIESVNVLKGAASSALYGSRGSNGVILITTKKGSKRKGIGVTVNAGMQVGTFDKSTLPEYQTLYGQGYGSAGYDKNYPDHNGFFYYTPVFNSNGTPVNVVQTDVDQPTGPAYDKNLMVYNWDAFVPGNPNYGKATPWLPAAHHNPTDYFETPVNFNTSVFIDGGSDKGTFKLGYTRSEENGYLPNSNLIKHIINFGATYNITDKLTAGASVAYSQETGIGRYGYGYSGANPMTDFRQWWPTNVDIKEQKADYFRTHTNASWNWLGDYTNLDSLGIAYHNNLYWDRYENTQNDRRNRIFGNVNLNYKVTSFLNILARASIDNYNMLSELRTAVGSVDVGAYSRENDSYNENNFDLIANFDKDITKDLNLKALLGGNIRQQQTSSIYATTSGGLVVPRLYTIANSKSAAPTPTETYKPREVDGRFGGVTLTWREMLSLDGTLRNDVSSTLPKGNNSYWYYSVSGSFVFSKLLQNTPWLSYGKLRANYAEVGNDAPVFSTTNTYQNVLYQFGGQSMFAAPYQNNNADLRPEKTKSYEAGLEMSFLKRRVGFDVTYYNARTVDQIMPISVSPSSGYTTYYVNGGTVRNAGVEVSIDVAPIRNKDFSWDMRINWNKNNNKVLSLYNNQPSYQITSWQNSVTLNAVVGKSWGIIRGTDYEYVNGKKLVDENGYYVLNSNSLSDIGNINPDWMGGISNTFRYKNLALSFLVDVRHGGQVYSLDMDYGSGSGIYPYTAANNDQGKPLRSSLENGGGIILPGVTADGKANTVRIDASDINSGAYPFSSAYGMADKEYIYDASYIKLRELSITYSLPASALKKINWVKGIDFSLTGRNLWIIHKNLPYADPEQGVASGNASMGFQSGAYPTVRMFGANVKLRF
jgi:TonB-linked SusC/RagA family outer membrane protein